MKTKSIFNKLTSVLSCTLLAMIIVASCKKDYRSQDQPGKQELSKLEQWYQNNLKVSDDNPFSKLKPNWTDVYVRQQGPHNVYEMSLGNQEKLVVSINEEKRNLQEVAQHTGMRLLIFEERASNKILYASYMNVQANSGKSFDNLHYKNVGNFTGTILYYHFSGNLSNGWNYLNGKITEKITAITEQQFSQAQKQSKGDKKTDAMVCTSGFADKYQWQCVGVPGYLNCGFNYVGKEYITVCNWQEPEQTIDHIAPDDNGGGYMPPIYIDCAGVENGKATWSTQCNTCIGGTTGIGACPKEVKVDSTVRKCIDTLSKGVLSNASTLSAFNKIFTIEQNFNNVNDMINRISQSSDWNVILKEGSINSEVNYAGDTISTNASTTASQGKVIITFSTSYLNQATDLSVARTMIHELMHAYFVYGLAQAYDPGYAKFVEANELLFKKNGNPLNDQNSAQHEQIAAKYVNQLSDLLEAYAISAGITSPDPTLSLREYCKDLAWGGLKDTKAYRKYAPNKSRIERNLRSEALNDSNSTKKKKC